MQPTIYLAFVDDWELSGNGSGDPFELQFRSMRELEIDLGHCRSVSEAKEYLFNLDGNFYRRAVRLLRSGKANYARNDLSGVQYYVMSKLFNGAVEKLFSIGNPRSAIENR